MHISTTAISLDLCFMAFTSFTFARIRAPRDEPDAGRVFPILRKLQRSIAIHLSMDRRG